MMLDRERPSINTAENMALCDVLGEFSHFVNEVAANNICIVLVFLTFQKISRYFRPGRIPSEC